MPRPRFKRSTVTLATSIVLALGVFALTRCAEAALPAGADSTMRPADPVAPGRWIVVMHDDARRPGPAMRGVAAAAAVNALATRHGAQPDRSYAHVLRGFSAALTDAQVQALRADPAVRSVEPDRIVRIQQAAALPWGLDRIDQARLPLDGAFRPAASGAGVTAYVVDTGIRGTHADFGGRVLPGFSTQGGDGTADCNGHGTHVAGTVGGATFGVAKRVALVPVRVLGCDGSGSVATLIAGLDWIHANHRKPAVVNMSLGMPGSMSSLEAAVERLVAAGITVAVAAGNEANDACAATPARVPGAITVGAVNASDQRPFWSGAGVCVDLHAPGVAIRSARHDSDTDSTELSGTSMATPHVAGAAALVLERSPALTPREVTDVLVASATAGVLRGHWLDAQFGQAPWEYFGSHFGTPNLLLDVSRLAAPRVPAPVARASVVCVGLTCELDGTALSDAVRVTDHVWRIEGRGVLKGAKTRHTFLGAIGGRATLQVRNAEGLADAITIDFPVRGEPANPPCGECDFEAGMTSEAGMPSYAPGNTAFRVDEPMVLTAWLAAPYAGTSLPRGVQQRLSLVRYDLERGAVVTVATTGMHYNVPLSLSRTVFESGWYAWEVSTLDVGRHFALWMKHETMRGESTLLPGQDRILPRRPRGTTP